MPKFNYDTEIDILTASPETRELSFQNSTKNTTHILLYLLSIAW